MISCVEKVVSLDTGYQIRPVGLSCSLLIVYIEDEQRVVEPRSPTVPHQPMVSRSAPSFNDRPKQIQHGEQSYHKIEYSRPCHTLTPRK